jgi:hypothetical protein
MNMDDLSKVAPPALIALIGTSVTALVGYRQWKRQHDTTRQSKFQTDRGKLLRKGESILCAAPTRQVEM